jgi:hypothetical protein
MNTTKRRTGATLAGLAAPLAALAFPAGASAHGLVSRADLPVPSWLFAWAATVVLIISFFALSSGWKKARFEQEAWRPWGPPGLSAALLGRVAEVLAGALGAFLLGLTVWSGLHGSQDDPGRNFSVTFAFVTAWLGFPFLSVFLGDVFRPFNPWRAIGRATGAGFRALAGQKPGHLRYPEWLGRWPAAAGLVAFVWLELIYGASGVSAGLTAHDAGLAALIYSVYTLAMIAVFGTEQWCSRGEIFSVFFNMFSQLAPLEVRERRLGRRRMFSGAAHWATVPGSLAMVVASIATTSFDGGQEGVFKGAIESTFNRALDAGLGLVGALRLSESIWMAICLVGVAALFLLGVRGMRTIRESPSLPALRTDFAHTLIPIAFAYLLAHYFSLFVFQEQAQFTYLLSDPLGTGADIFGTVNHSINYGVLSAQSIWYVQVAALVAGHVCGLTLAHDKAVAVWRDYKLAARSQYWMLAVMVCFTCFGLYLLSQSNQ